MRTQAARTPTGTLLLFLLLVDSLHFVFARLLTPHLPAQVAGLYVLAVGTVEVGLFLLLRRRIAWHVLWENKRFFLALGLLVGGATAFSYNSVRFVDPGTASFLSQSTTLFSLFLGVVWLRDALSRPEMFGALVAISGSLCHRFPAWQPAALGRTAGPVIHFPLRAACGAGKTVRWRPRFWQLLLFPPGLDIGLSAALLHCWRESAVAHRPRVGVAAARRHRRRRDQSHPLLRGPPAPADLGPRRGPDLEPCCDDAVVAASLSRASDACRSHWRRHRGVRDCARLAGPAAAAQRRGDWGIGTGDGERGTGTGAEGLAFCCAE